MISYPCPWHPHIILGGRTGVCVACADDFFRRHGIISDKYVPPPPETEEQVELEATDLLPDEDIIELDDLYNEPVAVKSATVSEAVQGLDEMLGPPTGAYKPFRR